MLILAEPVASRAVPRQRGVHMAVRGALAAAAHGVGASLVRLESAGHTTRAQPHGAHRTGARHDGLTGPPPALSGVATAGRRPAAQGPAGPRAGAPDIVARTLGATRIWVRGTRIERWGTKRGLMILRYLLWHDAPVRRETLMHLLWPDSTHQSARNNLNVAVHGLRRTLESGGTGPFVVHRDGAYQLAPGCSVWTDARVFIDVCTRADRAVEDAAPHAAERLLRHAVDLYGGPLFADDATAEWYLQDRRALAELFVRALQALAALRFDSGDAAESVELCRRALRVEPCCEITHRLLMRSYARQGLHHLVARQYKDCVAALETHLDVTPRPDTTRLFLELVGAAS